MAEPAELEEELDATENEGARREGVYFPAEDKREIVKDSEASALRDKEREVI